MSDAQSIGTMVHFALGYGFIIVGLATIILVVTMIILVITDLVLERRHERWLAQRTEAWIRERQESDNKEQEETVARANQWRIERERQRIKNEVTANELKRKHWQMWRDFLDGQGVNTPYDVESELGAPQSLSRVSGLYILRQCKFAGRSLTRRNLADVFKEQYPGLPAQCSDEAVDEAVDVLFQVRERLNALPMAA